MSKGKELGFTLYLITEGRLRDLDDTSETGAFFKSIEEALAGGVKAIQLREKALGGSRLLEVACKLRELTRQYSAKLFINDRVDVALLSDADGVHLPSSGLDVEEVRALIESRAAGLIIGVSTHSLEEAKEAERQGAGFITFGPVFFTQSKARYGEPVGVKRLAEVCKNIETPVFALGGVDRENVGEVMGAGAYGVAMISEILGEEDIKESTARIIKELSK